MDSLVLQILSNLLFLDYERVFPNEPWTFEIRLRTISIKEHRKTGEGIWTNVFFQFHSEFNGPLRLKEGFYINLIREYFEKFGVFFHFDEKTTTWPFCLMGN